MHVLALVNASIGSLGNEEDPRQKVRELFAHEGIVADVRVLPGAQIRQEAARAVKQGQEVVVAVGGDGTLNAAASALICSSTALGILPIGTHNHFAKDAGIPLNLNEAVKVIAKGEQRTVDVGEVNGSFFLNNASIGVYVRVVEEREALLEFFPRPKWLATSWAALRLLHRSPVMHIDLDVKGHRIHQRTPFLFVGNNCYEIDLLHLRQRSRLDLGQLSVFYLARCRTRFCLYRLLWLALRKRLNQDEDFQGHCANTLRVNGHGSSVRVALDGEVHRLRWPLEFRSRARGLRLAAPPFPSSR